MVWLCLEPQQGSRLGVSAVQSRASTAREWLGLWAPIPIAKCSLRGSVKVLFL